MLCLRILIVQCVCACCQFITYSQVCCLADVICRTRTLLGSVLMLFIMCLMISYLLLRFVHSCMCVYVTTCMVCVCVCMCVCVRVCVRTRVCLSLSLCISICVCACVCVCLSVSECACVCVSLCSMCMYTYICNCVTIVRLSHVMTSQSSC